MWPAYPRLLLVAVSAALLQHGCYTAEEKKVLVCYLAEWSVTRVEPGDYSPSLVDVNLCDVIVYAYAGLDPATNKITSITPSTDFGYRGKGLIPEIVGLKKENPKLKITLSCGGWNQGSIRFSDMAQSKTRRTTFIKSVIDYLKKYNFDGFDLAWEYPTFRGGSRDDKDNHATLIEELREEFDKHGYLLTAQLMSKRDVISACYDIPRLSNALHYISLVTYQYHYPGEQVTGHNAPLHSNDVTNVEYALNYVLSKGASPDKVLLGFSTYGHPYIMDEKVTDGAYIGVSASKTYAAPWSREPGYIGFNEACYEVTSGSSWVEHWDSFAKVPFAVNGNKFMSYDNINSYEEKFKLLASKKLKGAMVWSIDTDDFRGLCYDKKYPLIGKLRELLDSYSTNEGSGDRNDFNVSVIVEEFIKSRDFR